MYQSDWNWGDPGLTLVQFLTHTDTHGNLAFQFLLWGCQINWFLCIIKSIEALCMKFNIYLSSACWKYLNSSFHSRLDLNCLCTINAGSAKPGEPLGSLSWLLGIACALSNCQSTFHFCVQYSFEEDKRERGLKIRWPVCQIMGKSEQSKAWCNACVMGKGEKTHWAQFNIWITTWKIDKKCQKLNYLACINKEILHTNVCQPHRQVCIVID